MSPEVMRMRGYRFFFSNEGDEPPHIHVESAGNYAKFWLDPVVLADAVGYNGKELRRIRDLVTQHRELFEGNWNEYFRD